MKEYKKKTASFIIVFLSFECCIFCMLFFLEYKNKNPSIEAFHLQVETISVFIFIFISILQLWIVFFWRQFIIWNSVSYTNSKIFYRINMIYCCPFCECVFLLLKYKAFVLLCYFTIEKKICTEPNSIISYQ